MKFFAILGVLMALVCAPAHAQFSAGQVLKASQLNSALASPSITGGSINGAPIGQSTPAAGAFTSFSAGAGVFTGQVSLGGSAGAEALRAITAASAVNYVQVQGGSTGNGPGISSRGSDANVDLAYSTQGTGRHSFWTGSFARVQAAILDTAGANRYLTFTGSNGGNPTIGASAGRVAITPGLDASPIGAVTPSTGAFTTLAASSTVSGSGFDSYITSANTRGLIDSMTNAKAYGALGNSNGTHGNGNDDTTALQNALNASANGILHIPCGTYRITASLVESSTNNYWIQGDGQCTKIFNDSATPVPTFLFNPSSPNGNVNPTVKIDGIYFINPNVTGPTQATVSFTNEERPYYTNNIVYGYQVGVVFNSTYAPVIDHNTFFRTIGPAIDCSADASCNNATIIQNGFFTNGLINSAPAIDLLTPTNINGITIMGNDIEGNYGGIGFQNVSSGIVAGNYIENQTGFNLYFGSGNSSIDINGNWFGASPSMTLTNGLSNSNFQNNTTYNYAVSQGTSTSVRQINNNALGTGGISLPTVGQLNSNSTTGTSMTRNTPINCTSITLPAGSWDISGSIKFQPTSTTVTSLVSSSISLTANTIAPQPNTNTMGGISANGNTVGALYLSTPTVRENFASSTPVYLVGNSQFTTSTQTCDGYIRAVLVQ